MSTVEELERLQQLLGRESVKELLGLTSAMRSLGPLGDAPSVSGTRFPTAIDDLTTLPNQDPGDVVTSAESNNQSAAIKAIETKLGVTSSADAASIDYLLKNTSGGHNHNATNSRQVPWASGISGLPSTFAPAAHGATAHTGDIFPDASDQGLGAGSVNITPRTAASVSNPGAGRTIFVDSADGTLKVKDSGGSLYSLEGGGTGGGAPTTSTYLVATADGTLTNEVVVGATPGGELGGTWAAPTVDDLHASIAHSAMARKDLANVHTAGPNTFQSGAAGTKALIAKGAVAQSANLQEWQDSSGGALATISAAGVLTLPSAAFGTPGVSNPSDVANAGAAATFSRSDHRHARETMAAGSVIASVAANSAPGVATSYPRSDHVHGHGVGYLPDAHHTQAHSDADHTGAGRFDVWSGNTFRGTRSVINFVAGLKATDIPGSGRVDITTMAGERSYANATTWTNMPVALAPFQGNGTTGSATNISGLRRSVQRVDLSSVTQVRLHVAVGATAGPTGSGLQLRYALTDSVTESDYIAAGVGGATIRTVINIPNHIHSTGWTDLVAAARVADVYLALFGDGGNVAVSPVFGKVSVEFR